MDITIPYYEDNSRINNSIIGKFIKNGPMAVYDYLNGNSKNESGPQLERGTMIHEYILQPEEFDKDYLLYNGETPKSSQQEAFCEHLLNTVEIEPQKAAVSAYKASYKTSGKSEENIASEAVKLASTLKSYIDAKKSGKKLISDYDIMLCHNANNGILTHKKAKLLLNDNTFKEYHEFHINWEFDGILKCKSLLDCVKFDFDKKICQIIDLKTTTKLWHFEESVEKYDYTRQLLFYKMAVMWYLKEELHENVDKWSFESYIIAIDSTSKSGVRVFNMTNMCNDTYKLSNILTDIAWHMNSKKWEHSRQYYEGDGLETLSN